MDDLRLEIAGRITDVDPAQWDACAGDDNPFVEHAFLRVLEEAGCLGDGTGWYPHYLLARTAEDAPLQAAAPLYARTDSQGEYIFDYGWAQGAMRAGLDYYPKLTVAVPFTPATGPRLLVHAEADRDLYRRALASGAATLADRIGASSAHWLFCTADEAAALADLGHLHRETFQFHWHNPGYDDFDDFLGDLDRKRRKEIRRERGKAYGHGLDIVLKEGTEMTAGDWEGLWRFYQATHDARPWQQRYLNRAWFDLARSDLAHRAVSVIAYDGTVPVAGSLSFRKGPHLYGRYWGALADLDALHFECCYYRLVEYAIDEGITLFEAGAQGEHKLRRGFLPAITHSAHHIVHPGLRDAIADFLSRERWQTRRVVERFSAEGPFGEGRTPAARAAGSSDAG